MGDEEVQGLFAHLEGHEGPVPVVLPLAGKAVGAVEVAGVGHMEAEGLDHGAAVFEVKGHGLEGIRGVELPGLLQGAHVLDAAPQVLPGDVGAVPVLLQHGGDDLLRAPLLVQGDDVVGHVVHHVDRAGAGVQNDIAAIELILMDHIGFLLKR